MNLSQSISFVNSYMNKNIEFINDIYASINKLFLKTKNTDVHNNKFFKADFNDEYKDIEDLFDDVKRNREEFIKCIENIRENKNEEDVKLGMFNFHNFDDRLDNLDILSIKLYRIIKKYEEICVDQAENMEDNTWNGALAVSLSYNYKRIKITELRKTAKRLLDLIDSNRKFLGSITGEYSKSPHEEELNKE